MQLEMFINFDGNCREAVGFYAKVFRSEVHGLMTYGDIPADSGYIAPEADKDKVTYAEVMIGGVNVMFMDLPTGHPCVRGGYINPTVSSEDKDEVRRLFDELKEGGKVHNELQQTFFSELYGMVEDKFGVVWLLCHYAHE